MHLTLFLIFGAVCIAGAVNLLAQRHPINSALSLIAVMAALAGEYLLLGAEFVAAVQVIVYAGAIMVLFVFVVMMLNLGPQTKGEERLRMSAHMWLGPFVLSAVLLAELIYILAAGGHPVGMREVGPKEVALVLFGPYLLGAELASLLLLSGLIGAYHLGRRGPENRERREETI